jgi:hypothetical protein
MEMQLAFDGDSEQPEAPAKESQGRDARRQTPAVAPANRQHCAKPEAESRATRARPRSGLAPAAHSRPNPLPKGPEKTKAPPGRERSF